MRKGKPAGADTDGKEKRKNWWWRQKPRRKKQIANTKVNGRRWASQMIKENRRSRKDTTKDTVKTKYTNFLVNLYFWDTLGWFLVSCWIRLEYFGMVLNGLDRFLLVF